MTLFAHSSGSAPAARELPFDLVHAHHAAVPAMLWLATIGFVLVVAAAQNVHSRLAKDTPSADEVGSCFSHGA